MLGGNFFHEILGLVDGAQVSTDSDFLYVREAQLAHTFLQFGGSHAGELVDKGRRHNRDDLVAALDRLNQLENLALIDDGAEGAVDKAHAAGYTLVVIDIGTTVLVRVDGA